MSQIANAEISVTRENATSSKQRFVLSPFSGRKKTSVIFTNIHAKVLLYQQFVLSFSSSYRQVLAMNRMQNLNDRLVYLEHIDTFHYL